MACIGCYIKGFSESKNTSVCCKGDQCRKDGYAELAGSKTIGYWLTQMNRLMVPAKNSN
jgi:hypothetical protein